jgi:GNAT superfamily N-acetyltransferase
MKEQRTIEVTAARPAEFTPAERAAFMHLVREGGEVNPDTLPGLVVRAEALALARKDGVLVGVSAVKRPYPTHRRNVFKAAKADLLPDEFAFELGWVFVLPNARGLGFSGRLVAVLMPYVEAAHAYATSRADNASMHATLKRFGFKGVGETYPSKQNDTPIQLFVRA